jgi:FkbM family methyltransferase
LAEGHSRARGVAELGRLLQFRKEYLSHVDLLKVDVEKAELDVLRGVGEAD